jgi:flavin-binding protein dodecin
LATVEQWRAVIAMTLATGLCRPDRVPRPIPEAEGGSMAVTKIIELVGSSSESSDGAVKAALDEARVTLRNIKAVDVVSTGLRGDNLDEWRALVRISILIDRVTE